MLFRSVSQSRYPSSRQKGLEMLTEGLDEQSNIDLRQGDCLELMKDIPDGSIDLILTDPPYGVDLNIIPTKTLKTIG